MAVAWIRLLVFLAPVELHDKVATSSESQEMCWKSYVCAEGPEVPSILKDDAATAEDGRAEEPHGSGEAEKAEGEEEAEKAEREESEEVKPGLQAERLMSMTVLGAVAFQMTLFYLVNWPDPDMRRYSYTVVGQTISIFCAVLTFHAFYSIIESQVNEWTRTVQCVALPSMCLIFWALMEVLVMASCQVSPETALHKQLAGKVELSIPKYVLNAKTYGAFGAQMCGTAALIGFGHLQFRAYYTLNSIPLVAAVVVLAFIVLFTLMKFCALIRRCMFSETASMKPINHKWSKIAEECENEVFSLCMGFLIAVLLRTILTDSLPFFLLEGFRYRENLMHAKTSELAALFGVGFSLALLAMSLVICCHHLMETDLDRVSMETLTSHRLFTLFVTTISMTFAWCLCFVIHLYISQLNVVEEGIRLRLIIALVQSGSTILFIRLLDCFADMQCTGDAFDGAMLVTINSLAAAIGLSWEHVFQDCVIVAVEFMCEDSAVFTLTNDPKIWCFCLSSGILFTVMPAYRLYIVPVMYGLLDEYEERHEGDPASARASQSVQTAPFSNRAYSQLPTDDHGNGFMTRVPVTHAE